MKSKPHVAGLSGSLWELDRLHLLERGARALYSMPGAGKARRASSGGETRIHALGLMGPDQPYTALACPRLKLWAKYEQRWKRQFLHRTGVSVDGPASRDDGFERGSLANAARSGDQVSGNVVHRR